MKSIDLRIKIVNFFGAIGYFLIGLQWLWALIIIGYPLLTNPHLLLRQTPTRAPHSGISISLPPEITLIIVGIVTVIMIALTIVMAIAMPKTITSTTAQITHAATRTVTPLVANAPKEKKKRRVFSTRVMAGVKIVLFITPLLSIFFAPQNAPLPYEVIAAVAGFGASMTLIAFSAQYGLAALLKVPLVCIR